MIDPSTFCLLLAEYKQHFEMPRHIIKWKFLAKKLFLILHCLEEDINLDVEIMFFKKLFVKRGLAWMNYKPFTATKLTSVKKNYSPTYNFTSEKQ